MKQKFHSAFTIVELLLVIVIIGILAGLTAVGLGSWRTHVAETEVQNDAAGIQAGMEDARNRLNGYPVFGSGIEFDGTNSTKDIFTQSEFVSITYNKGDAKAYCVDIRSKAVPGVYLFLDTTSGNKSPKKGTCDGGEGARPMDPNLATTFTPSNRSSSVSAIDVDRATGDVYYKVANSALYKYSYSDNKATTIASGFNTDAMAYGENGKLYVFSNRDGGTTRLQSIDLATGIRTDLSPREFTWATAMYKDESKLYIVADKEVLAFDLTNNSWSQIYSSISKIRSTGLAIVGSDLYFDQYTTLYKVPKSGGSATQVTTFPPGPRPTSDARGIVYIKGKIYTFIALKNTTSIFSYDIARDAWTEAVADVAYVLEYNYSCAYPSSLTAYGNRLVYFSAPPSDWAGSCTAASSKVQLYMTPAP